MTRFALPLLSLLFVQSAYSYDLPREIVDFFSGLHLEKKVEAFANVQTLNPDQFVDEFMRSGPQQLVGAGVEGIVFKDAHGFAWKFSLAIADALGLVTIEPSVPQQLSGSWEGLTPLKTPQIKAFFEERSLKKWPMRSQSLQRELIGGLLWSEYSPVDTNQPVAISSDGFAFKSRYVEGPLLSEVLKSDREGKSNYAMAKVFSELTRLQYANLKMLLGTGFAVDLFSPMNIIVSGTPQEPRLFPVDHGLSAPQADVREWFQRRGLEIPRPNAEARISTFVSIMVIPAMIVSHKLWKLSYDQALRYIQTQFSLPGGESAEMQLASLRPWVSQKNPEIIDHQNILKAREKTGWTGDDSTLASNLCMGLLTR